MILKLILSFVNVVNDTSKHSELWIKLTIYLSEDFREKKLKLFITLINFLFDGKKENIRKNVLSFLTNIYEVISS